MLAKVPVDADQLAAVVAPLGELTGSRPLDGGLSATTFAVDLAPVDTATAARRVVVKIIGDDVDRLLRYERGILGTEALVYQLAADVPELPMPRLLLYDDSRTHIPGTAVVTEFLDGDPWANTLLDHAEQAVVRRDLGSAMARLHTITGPTFGYPAPESDLAADTWPAAFAGMIDAALDDARRFDVDVPADRIRGVVADHLDALTVVKEPRLIHTDLWEGNVFLGAHRHVSGLIDPERALWGDPLFEFAGADQMGIGPVNQDLLAGYSAVAATGVVPPVDPDAGQVRLDLYRLYFSTFMTVEATPRGYDGEWVAGHLATLWRNLHALLDRLGS